MAIADLKQIPRKLRIWSHSLKKFLMENFLFYAVKGVHYFKRVLQLTFTKSRFFQWTVLHKYRRNPGKVLQRVPFSVNCRRQALLCIWYITTHDVCFPSNVKLSRTAILPATVDSCLLILKKYCDHWMWIEAVLCLEFTGKF